MTVTPHGRQAREATAWAQLPRDLRGKLNVRVDYIAQMDIMTARFEHTDGRVWRCELERDPSRTGRLKIPDMVIVRLCVEV